MGMDTKRILAIIFYIVSIIFTFCQGVRENGHALLAVGGIWLIACILYMLAINSRDKRLYIAAFIFTGLAVLVEIIVFAVVMAWLDSHNINGFFDPIIGFVAAMFAVTILLCFVPATIFGYIFFKEDKNSGAAMNFGVGAGVYVPPPPPPPPPPAYGGGINVNVNATL